MELVADRIWGKSGGILNEEGLVLQVHFKRAHSCTLLSYN